MLTKANVTLLAALWLASLPLLALALIRFRRPEEPRPADAVSAAPREPEQTGDLRPFLVLVGVLAGLVSALLAARSSHYPWVVVWAPALVSVVCVVAAGKLTSRASATATDDEPAPGSWDDVFALGTALVFSAMAFLIFRANADDIFYVNRATATDQLGHIPVRDVIFTHEQAIRGGGAGLPVDSYSALQGTLAHILGVNAVSVAYYAFPPVFTFLATWTVWRLLRAWAPRRAWLCFALGSLFWLWSAQDQLTSGNYFLSRMWQGKVAFVSWLVPALYVYVTRWLGKRDAYTACLALTAAFSSIGATGSATFVTPLVFATALIPLAVRREWRALPVPLAGALIPLGIGLGVLSQFPLSENIGVEKLLPEAWFFHEIFGVGAVGAIAALGLWAAPWIVRGGPAQQLTAGLVVVVVVLLAPGMIALLSDATNLTATLRRTFWIVPFPALVGLLAAVRPSRVAVRAGSYATAVAVAAALILFGMPFWTYGSSLWQFPPVLKVPKADVASAILRKYHGERPILAGTRVMGAIAILTADPKAVNARSLYLIRTRELDDIPERLALTRFITGLGPQPSLAAVRRAMADLEVGLVCVNPVRADVIPFIRRAGPFRRSFTAAGDVCFRRVPSGAAAALHVGPSGTIDRRFPAGRDDGPVSF